MKGFNIFLAILIFLLALVSAVFSYFLFEKRAQLIYGWGLMAAKINETATTLDAGSGTSLATKLTREALAQDKHDELAELLPELLKQTDEVVKERDALAKTLAAVSVTLEKRDLPAEQFKLLSAYEQSLKTLLAYVQQYQRRNNAILNSVVNTSRSLGAQGVSVAALKSSSYASAYSKIDARVRYWQTRDRDFSRQVTYIASAVGVRTPNLSEKTYVKSLGTVVDGVRKVKRERDDFEGKFINAQRNIKSLNAVLAKRNSEIKSLKATCDKKDREIIRLSKVLGLEIPRLPMEDGCKDALELVRAQEKGRIIDVDDKFGFYVTSLGKNTRVQEQFGNKVNNVDPMIPQGTILTIARNMGEGNPVLIVGKARLVKLDANCSILEPVGENNKRPRLGDLVYVADDEILNILKKRK